MIYENHSDTDRLNRLASRIKRLVCRDYQDPLIMVFLSIYAT